MASYTQEDGRALSKAELLRLLVLANGYEMVLCVEECVEALRSFDGYDDALAYFRAVPDSLLHIEPLRAVTQEAADTLVEALGPVEALWQSAGAVTSVYRGFEFEVEFILDERVKALPIDAIEGVLRSEKLQLMSENSAFSLAYWWVLGQTDTAGERRRLFTRLLKSLRYERMSSVFLTSIIQHNWVQYSGLLSWIVARGFWRRDGVPLHWVPPLPPSRVKEPHREWNTRTFTTHITREAVEALQEEKDSIYAPLGLLQGFPLVLRLCRPADRYAFGILCPLLMPNNGDEPDDAARGFAVTIVSCKVGRASLPTQKTMRVAVLRSQRLFVTRPADGLFEEGRLKVELKLQMKQHKHC
jgi:hypothetical protein